MKSSFFRDSPKFSSADFPTITLGELCCVVLCCFVSLSKSLRVRVVMYIYGTGATLLLPLLTWYVYIYMYMYIHYSGVGTKPMTMC